MIKVGLIQPGVTHYQVENNLRMYESRLEELRRSGVQLAVLPEFFPTGNTLEPRLLRTAIRTSQMAVDWMGEQSKKLDMAIAGSFLCLEQGHVTNRFAVQEPGRPIVWRRKSFIPAAEAVYSRESNDGPIVETSFGKVGLIICAESFVPDIVRADYSGCAAIFIAFAIPNLFVRVPAVRERLTRLPRLLAQRNKIPVVLCSMGGRFGTRGSVAVPLVWRGAYAGRSGIYFPDGQCVGPLAPGQEGILTADVPLGPSEGMDERIMITAGLPRMMAIYDKVFGPLAKAVYEKNLDVWL